jgi:hypothetical protein
MKRTWSYFLGAVILSAYLLLANGAPLPAVAAGIAGAATFVWRRSRAR